METLSLSNFVFAYRNSDASKVQAGVFAVGKKKSRTRGTLKFFREGCVRPSEARVNSGALSPILSMDSFSWDSDRPTGGHEAPPTRSGPLQMLREQAADDVVDRLRIGLAFGGLHYLADKKFEDAFVTGFEFGYVVGIFFDDLARGLFDGVVRDLRAAPFGCNEFEVTRRCLRDVR